MWTAQIVNIALAFVSLSFWTVSILRIPQKEILNCSVSGNSILRGKQGLCYFCRLSDSIIKFYTSLSYFFLLES